MIDKLTQVQENKLKEYRDKYIARGLSTNRIDREMCITDMKKLYEKVLMRPSPSVVILDNPFFCWIAVNVYAQVRDQVRDQVHDQGNKLLAIVVSK